MQTPRAKTSLDHFSPHVAQHRDGPIKVRAILKGFYGNTLRNPGDEFGINMMEEFGAWMELVADETVSAPNTAEPEPKKGDKVKSSRGAKSDDDVL